MQGACHIFTKWLETQNWRGFPANGPVQSGIGRARVCAPPRCTRGHPCTAKVHALRMRHLFNSTASSTVSPAAAHDSISSALNGSVLNTALAAGR